MKIAINMSDDLIFSYGCAGSDYRELLLKRAKDDYAKGNIKSSIFYQIKSLCTEFESRFSGHNEDSDWITLEPNMKETKLIKESLVLKYALGYLKKRKKRLSSEDIIPLDSVKDSTEGMQRVEKICSFLPHEWTVIQMCKEQKNSTTFSMFREIIASDAPIYLSILKHPRSEEFPEPICLRLTSSNQAQLFEKFSILTSSYTELSTFPSGPATHQDRENYWAGMAVLETRVSDAVSELKAFMGPWVSLLCGNVKNEYKDQQKALFEAVDEFCDSNQFDWQHRVLLSLLAQQRHLLTDEHIKQASLALVYIQYMSASIEDAEESTAYRIIYEFLTQIPRDGKIEFGPCILILDERIDHFYWEVLNPSQELCRMSSFHILVRLFERYKSRIKNGYLMVDAQQGRSVINPECNLPNMEERMKSFFNYWLPSWKCTYNVVPKAEDFMKIFDEADCYVYCGHGSGLQYINGRKISKFQMKCVVFLFGCDSVRLRSKGLHSEMIASHLFYHAALCPAVVGTLQLGFDFQVDKIATTLLSEWLPSSSEDVVHWHHIDKASWKKGSIKPVHAKQANVSVDNYEGSLARAVSAIHQKTEEKLYNTVGFVYRGLPAWNSSNTYLK